MTTGRLERSPALTSAGLSILAALIGVGVMGSISRLSLLVGVLGVALLGYGAVFGSRKRVTHGVVALFVGLAVAAGSGAGAATLLPATLCLLLAWDVGRYGVTVGDQLGRDADTARAELSHAALSTAVGAAGALVGYGAYVAVGGSQPVLAVALLLGGAVALVAVVR